MTTAEQRLAAAQAISTHTPHTRHDQWRELPWMQSKEFLLTRLIRGMTCSDNPKALATPAFLLTRLIRGMTGTYCAKWQKESISTHTPHTRHDSKAVTGQTVPQISTHTPHTRHDSVWYHRILFFLNFYSHASYEA